MKKLLTIACIAMCALMLFACADKKQEVAEPDNTQKSGEMKVAPLTADVYVTFANAGELVLKQSKTTVTDLNDDKKFDLNEVFVAAHKLNGKENDYASSVGEWGLSIDKFWGDTSGNFGYYVNNAMAMGLTDEVKSGDYVDVYVMQYKNETYDRYTFFDVREAAVVKGGEFELTLNYIGFVGWDAVTMASADCAIVVNGEKTTSATDADGRVKLSFEKAGTYVLSATSETDTLVPPVCIVTVK